MLVHVEKGRIYIRGWNTNLNIADQQRDRVVANIPSAILQRDGMTITTALSIDNFRKLRKLGAKLSKDPFTRTVVTQMQEDLEAYKADSQRVLAVKEDGVKAYDELYPDKPYVFKVKPFAHQVTGFHFLHSIKTPALFGDCGSGKTFQVLTFIESLKQNTPVALIVLCPVNLIYHVWQLETERFTNMAAMPLREEKSPYRLVGDFDPDADRKDPEAIKTANRRARKRHQKLLTQRFEADADVYVLNYENVRTKPKEDRLKKLVQRLKDQGKEVCLALDESSMFKSRTSKTAKAIKRIRQLCDRCIIMTGTPSPNGIIDLWSQFDILDDGQTLQPSFYDYQGDTHIPTRVYGATYKDKGGKERNVYKWMPKPGAPEEVHATIYPRMIRFRTEDCVDLPPQRFIVRPVSMTTHQADVYQQMEERLFVELEGEEVTAKVAVTKLLKLRQVTGGFIRNDEGGDHHLSNSKVDELDLILEQSIAPRLGDDEGTAPIKAIVWAQYQWEIKLLQDRYKKRYGARSLFGGISAGQRKKNITAFKEDNQCRLLICHPASAGHGLTLTEANYSIYYSLSHNFEQTYQSYRRITRPGQGRSMTFFFLAIPNTIDEELLTAIRRKKNLSDIVTDGGFTRDGFLSDRGKMPSEFTFDWRLQPVEQEAPRADRDVPDEPSDVGERARKVHRQPSLFGLEGNHSDASPSATTSDWGPYGYKRFRE